MCAAFFGVLLLIAAAIVAQQMRKTNVNSVLSGIEKLHQRDIAATVSRDVSQLVALLADDAVVIGQGDKPLVGKTAFQVSLTQNFAKNRAVKVLKYEPEFEDVQITGEVAYEWGYFNVTQQESATSKPMSFKARFLRVMKLQSDGSWKFVRVMWNT
jgi:ketosteroid isomerase-like protein